MKINILSIAEKYPGQGVYSATLDHKYILKKYSDYTIYENKILGDYDVLHIHTLNIKSFLSLLKNKKKSFCVISAHIVPNSLKGSIKFNKLWLPFFNRYLKYFYNSSDCILAVSDETKNELIKDLRINPNKILVFRNFVIKELFLTKPEEKHIQKSYLRKKYGYNDDDFIILGAGQIQPRKGITDFVETAKRLKNMKFIWAGGMPFKQFTEGYEEMNRLIKKAPNNVNFTGSIYREKMIDYYSLSDIFFLPSFHETFGLVVIEAAGSGLPLVLRDLPVYKQIFSPNYLSGNSVEDFVEIIKKLNINKELYDEYEKKSYQLFENYSDEKAFIKLKNIYEEGIKQKIHSGGKNVRR
ncbi:MULTISPECIES: glycosyltransferase family 4 protein [Petrotoga]|uniref:1,2-diacylglycerol-3-alpha-glucose alpha-1,2-galactosyltransferase n=1 Tax=Petrotoga sibirica TaxID=156202 RepID=A0A4R8ETI6_9BACT|nr:MULTISPECIES: glycosyltransferase family 4 protein [Petrotoga]TDX15616.1 1,2-diacylglycerol-3-alpha-glucose alpha-1,2-galactosyltransferase [Petrotoga sibirica]